MLPIARVTHDGIGVSNLERSLRFYRDLLGFTWEHELDVEGEPTDTLLRLRGTKLHAEYLTRDGVASSCSTSRARPRPPRPERPMNQYGLTHLSFR
jgi:catechol 2,3-dioxygenase-like lactoylglutathione lyase family enzyme